MNKKLIAACIIAAPMSLQAAPWNNAIEAGYSKTSGNSDVETLYVAGESHYEAGLYGADAVVKLDRQESDGDLKKEYYLAGAKAKRFFSDARRGYLFGAAQWEKDEPAGLVSNWNITVGPGYRWDLPRKQKLSVEVGVGYQSSDYTDNAQDYDGMVGRFYADYLFPINSAVTFKADTLSLLDEHRHQNTTNLKLESKLTSSLAMGAGLEYRYNSKPAAGKKSEDTTVRLTLKYAF